MKIIETEKIRNCKTNYKCIMYMAVIILLIIAMIYLSLQNCKYKETIRRQKQYIESNIADKSTTSSIYDYIDRLFANKWLFRNPWSDFEKILLNQSNQSNKQYITQSNKSYYHYVTTDVTKDEYRITIALPGFAKDDISILLSENKLNIRKTEDTKVDDDKNESKVSDDLFSFKIPNDVNQENITTELNNGLLTIKLPRLQSQSDKEIKIIPIN